MHERSTRARLRVGVDAWGVSGPLLYTGMGQYTSQLLRWLPRVANDVELFAYGAPGENRPDWLPEAVRWRTPGRRLPAKLTALHSRIVAVPAAARRDGLDVYHAAAVHLRPRFPPIAQPGCAVVVTLHDLIPMRHYDLRTLPRRQRVFYRWNLERARKAARLLTVSDHARDEICAGLGLEHEDVCVIPNGIDFEPNHDPRAVARLGIHPPYVLYAGSFEPRKNLAAAIDAFARLVARGRPENLVAIVEGDSGHASQGLERIAAAGLGDRVKLVANLSDPDVRALYTHAAALLFPSLAEGFGYPPLQAAACGVPAIASDLPVLRANLGSWARFTDPTRPDLIAASLVGLLDDAELRRRLSVEGPAVAARFSAERSACLHREVYAAAAGVAQ